MKKRFAVIVAALMLAGLVGCNTYTDDSSTPGGTSGSPGTSGTQPADTGPKSFTLADTGDPVTLDSAKSADNLSDKAFYYAGLGLYRAQDSTYIPDGATGYTISDDGLTITFRIREGLVWSDGEPLTAHDYRYAYLYFLDPGTGSIQAGQHYAVQGAMAYNMGEGSAEDVGVSCPDDHTLVFELAGPAPALLNRLLPLYPIREDYVEQYGETYGASAEAYINAGPFVLKSWEYEQKLEFEKNPLYWNADAVNITHITWLTIADKNTTMNMYDMGEIDHFSVPPANIDAYKDEQVIVFAQSGGNALQFNFSNSANPEAGRVLANLNFRKALGYAIERSALSSAISDPAYTADGRLLPAGTDTASGKPWNEEYPGIELYPNALDEAQAKAFLDAALDELGYSSPADLPTFTFLLFDVPPHRMYAEGFTDVWSRVLGVDNFDITVLPIPQAIQQGMSGQFDMYLAGISREADPYTLFANLAPGGPFCWGAWEGGDEFADMVAATNEMTDPKERYDALFECEQFFAENGYMLPLWSYGGTTATRPAVGLTGYTIDMFNSPNIQIVFADVIPDSQR